MSDDEPPVIQPPSSSTVDMERKPVLFLQDGRALVRRIGFSVEPPKEPK